jgi:asparagine synthase (glutamine-hydrolysing)
MCGITGFIDFRGESTQDHLIEMVNSMHHRGPDDNGTWLDQNAGAIIGLGHARLSIIDVSNAGHQPMHYNNFSIVFNGEIYNYKEIRAELEVLGYSFLTKSDTEVVLKSFSHWGKDSVNKFIGMFAITVYDREEQKIYFFRDRLGVKPMYYTFKNDIFLFGSELKSFCNHPRFNKSINISALSTYFDLGYIPAPATIYNDTYKLKQGHLMIFDLKKRVIETKSYWNIESFIQKESLNVSYNEAKNGLKDLLLSGCNYRMVADVPIGVFLSGGYDSSLVTGMLQTQRTDRIKTFTIGFERGNNEAPYAKRIAEYLNTDHTEYTCTEKEAQEIIPSLPFFFDEPFADQSAIPTILVSKIARKNVTVALSADGGDEAFVGYERYAAFNNHLKLMSRVPGSLKRVSSFMLRLMGLSLPNSRMSLQHRILGVANSLNPNKRLEAYNLYKSIHSIPEVSRRQLFECGNVNYTTFKLEDINIFKSEIEMAVGIDFNYYLPDDILTKVDRSTMSASLEGREPLLDHRLVEYAVQLPFSYKYDNFQLKKILKDITHEVVPKELMDRPKAGFSVPIFHWLRNDLRFLLDEYLSEFQLKKSGLLNVNSIQLIVEGFKSGKFYYNPLIWRLLMFQMWYARWMR